MRRCSEQQRPVPGRVEVVDRDLQVRRYGRLHERDDLVAVVARLEAGGATLEESLALWERGEALAARCQQWLDNARERLDAAHAADAGADT